MTYIVLKSDTDRLEAKNPFFLKQDPFKDLSRLYFRVLSEKINLVRGKTMAVYLRPMTLLPPSYIVSGGDAEKENFNCDYSAWLTHLLIISNNKQFAFQV